MNDHIKKPTLTDIAVGKKEKHPSPSLLDEDKLEGKFTSFLSKRRYEDSAVVGFDAGKEVGQVQVSIKEDNLFYLISLEANQLLNNLIEFYEKDSTRYVVSDNEELVFTIDKPTLYQPNKTRVKVIYFRKDNPKIIFRSIALSDMKSLYNLAVGSSTGVFSDEKSESKKKEMARYIEGLNSVPPLDTFYDG